MKKEKQIVSEEVYDAINASPPLLIRCGMAIIVIIILVLLATSSVINFPESISIPLKIVPNGQVYTYKINNTTSFIKSPYKPSGSYVSKGEKIATIRHTDDSLQTIVSPANGQVFSALDFNNTGLLIQIVPKDISYDIWGSVPEKYIQKLRLKQNITIILNTDTKRIGTISEISQLPINGLYTIKASVSDSKDSLPPAAFASTNQITCIGKIQVTNISILNRVFHQFFRF